MKVFLHTRLDAEHEWLNTSEEFDQVPAVGEYVCRAGDFGGGLAAVKLVLHIPKSAKTTFGVEVFAEGEFSHGDAMRQTGLKV